MSRLAVIATIALVCSGGLTRTFAAANPQSAVAEAQIAAARRATMLQDRLTLHQLNLDRARQLYAQGLVTAADVDLAARNLMAFELEFRAELAGPQPAAPGSSQAAPAGKLAGKYPIELQGSGAGATVTVDYVADYQGTVTAARIDASTDSRFDKAAVEAVRGTKFKPAMSAGTPVAAHDSIDVVFAADGQISATQPAPAPAAAATPAPVTTTVPNRVFIEALGLTDIAEAQALAAKARVIAAEAQRLQAGSTPQPSGSK